MDTVVLDGEQYVKASVLAKQFRYTADYIGQLCRAKKVDARLVGRTWFVNPQSVLEHREHKKIKPSSPQTTKDTPVVEKVVLRKQVPPVLQNKTVKTSVGLVNNNRAPEKTRNLSVAYEPDDETLLPTLVRKKTGPPKTIRIEHVDARKLKVGGKQLETNFHAGELPEVSLSGKLEIMTVPDVETVKVETENKVTINEKSDKNIDISSKPDKSKLVRVKLKQGKETSLVKISIDPTSQSVAATKPQTVTSKSVESVSQVKSVEESEIKAVPVSLIPSPVVIQQKTSPFLLMSPLIATVAALLCVLVIFSASVKVDVFDWGYQSQIILQVANLSEILSQ